ncbi:MAG: cation-transporting P-type ATPase [Acidimicrobiales bacterium]
MPRAEIEEWLETGSHGLSRREAEARLARYGANELVLALNAVIGFTQERKAETAVRALMHLVQPRARVVRDGHDREIDSRELVPGDLVLVESGVRVPGDLRLVTVNALQVDESLLTGESAPVTKWADAVHEGAPLPDRFCMAYTGATVTAGRATGVVVATGASTELGTIAGLIRGEEVTATPLQRRMERFAKLIGMVVFLSAISAFASGAVLGESAHHMFLVAVALSVAAVPEGLPIAVTITLRGSTPHGPAQRHHPLPWRRGDGGQHHGDRVRQDRHAHRESDDRPGPVDPRPPRGVGR